jgi:deazaflavin-dependent oxidoreductase (nitroreductase family)
MNPIFKLFLGANVLLFRATGGKIGSSMFGGRVLLLTTRGSKSGKERTVPVMYFQDGPNRVVIASAGGNPAHPAWYKNLHQHAPVTVEIKGRRYPARAETVTGSERARIWNKVVTEQPRFSEYAQKTKGREIPVVVLNEIDPDTRPC